MEVDDVGARRVMVVATPSASPLVPGLTAQLPVVHRHDEVVQHVPVEVAERARAAAAEHDVDLLVSIGGGSAVGLAKAVALTSERPGGLPIVAVPTTYAGSEVTDVWGLTEHGRKTTGSDLRVRPVAVVYDAELTLSMPSRLTVVSGLNALAHAVDSLWAPRADDDTRRLAGEGTGVLSAALARLCVDAEELSAREAALRGVYLCSLAFARAGSGLHHKICHVLGGRHDLPHAETHAVVLPHVVALNVPGAPEAERLVAEALGSASALGGLDELWDQLDAPRSLRDLGLEREALPGAVEAILPLVPDSNPVQVTAGELSDLLTAAWEGVHVS
jgi:maleylacetate reductase